ncbi:MAG: Glycosyl transferase group 1 [Microgenomates group bacterium GW2011_GWA1_48_10]|uniref:Glycosyl transferase family 1 domain-containing protein n=1 Tax=Candidatus Gottesmanbacteria bacterium RIFCSPHIGHO2_01_FULL_47_48 TaxID=1798381 RepID=A0A1F6A3A9_9BACT|nr:MAG: Glycosyl transferase group 1 [Microgenomates group bacterium GW2011_GWA1_48_10]OGG19149.1 MAG: hypothetical protein A2721_01890 [Candidatus Gottesmanbacteria bacterium RIFCSPHIGHO2_01_FULL_47_48]
MKVALVYDRLNKWGGAESVLLALHQIWPEAPLYTSVYDKNRAPWAKDFEVRTSFLQTLPLPKNKHEYYPFLMGIAFESFNFDEFDVVISVTHEFAKAIITKPHTLHICYCLTPTSYLWSGYDAYFSNKSELFKKLSAPIVTYLRWYDKIISHRPDKYVAISKTVQDRIKDYYGLESEVIYPPVSPIHFQAIASKWIRGNYFLIVSRLVSNKRIDIAVKAFNQLGLPLKIIGTGVEEQRLKNLGGSNVEFLGHLTHDEMAKHYQKCQALVVPGVEDFGLVSVEAQSHGKPVIAYRGGGSEETVIEGKTGYFFDEPTTDSLVRTIKKADLSRIRAEDCRRQAKQFGFDRFKKEILTSVEKSMYNN